ncbi:4'-phosphopantetheinyl transferase superfamily protein [Streptomyces tubercidicus]|uniref:4'-phosphopantetheinyl transferase superfamily protein n=1 Tax=Streptomyces tubercidicus TaxID=47759 RepID=UPI002E1062F9|nr:4'-phosphopantetheinyl transferase superfamily protein [Streptomyces tubercidicus]
MNAALLELCPQSLDQGIAAEQGVIAPRQHPGRTLPAPPAPVAAAGHPDHAATPVTDSAATPVPVFVVPVGSAPHASGTGLSPDDCPGLNGHSRGTLDSAARRRLRARLPERVSAAMADADHWELYGTRGLLVVACGDDARRMGFSVESVRPATTPPYTPYEVLTVHEAHLAAGRPAAARDRLVTRFWVRKDAALQAVGCGLSLAPERIEAGFHGDHGTVRVPGFHGAEVLLSVRNFAFSAAYECAVAVPESLALTPSFSYSAG